MFASQPEWIISVEVEVVCVQTDILGEIRNFLFLIIEVEVLGEVVVESVGVIFVVDAVVFSEFVVVNISLLFNELGLREDIAADEVEGIDFIRSGEDESTAVFTVEESYGEGVDEDALVHEFTSPASCFVEGLEVLGIVEEVEESDSFFPMFVEGETEQLEFRDESPLVEFREFFYCFGVLKLKKKSIILNV